MPESTDKSLYVRIGLVEEKVDVNTRKIDRLEDQQDRLDKTTSITEILVAEMQKREVKQELREEKQEATMNSLNTAITNMTATLNNINLSLHKLNSGQEELEKRVGKIEDNGKLDIMAIIKNVIWVGVPTAILLWLGLK